MEFDLLAFAFAPQLADKRKCPATNPEVLAIVLNAADLLESIFVEERLGLQHSVDRPEQANPTVIPQHFRMHPCKMGCVLQRK